MILVDIVRKYIMTERTGNWALHLQTIQNMLPYLAASGHNLYTNSAKVCLQQMANRNEEYPDVRERFQDGLQEMRRSERLWAGLSSDLIIEQGIMRCMNTSGGLPRGRGMTEQQHRLWLLPMTSCAEVNQAMQELTVVNYHIREQNKDMSKARQARDWKYTIAVVQYIQERNAFNNDASLRNIAIGVHANHTVNVELRY